MIYIPWYIACYIHIHIAWYISIIIIYHGIYHVIYSLTLLVQDCVCLVAPPPYKLRLIPAGAEATEVGSMSSTSGCGATEGVSHAKSLWQRLSGGEGSEQVNEDERQRKQ